MDLSQKIKRLVAERNLSDQMLAAALGDVSDSKVRRWRLGAGEPKLSEALRLCTVYSLSLDYLARDEISDPSDAAAANGLSEDQRTVLHVYRAMRISMDEALRRLAGLDPEIADAVDAGGDELQG